MYAPICLFTYNRLIETQSTIESLARNFLASESDLIIFSDGPKTIEANEKINEVRNYLHQVSGFKSVKINESDTNKGLANSIITGVSTVFEEYDRVIVLEDDLVTQPNFLDFMNQALNYYSNDKKVSSVNGYSLALRDLKDEVYFQNRSFPWGWGTWENRWDAEIFNKQKIKNQIGNNNKLLKNFTKNCGNDISKMLLDSLNNKNNSWYVRWVFFHFITNTYSVYPNHSFVENIGYSENGTHCRAINSYTSILRSDQKQEFNFIPFSYPEESKRLEFLEYFSFWSKLKVRLKLLKSSEGREKVIDEIKFKLKMA